jgi:hypothetical protein
MTLKTWKLWVQLLTIEYPEWWVAFLCLFAWTALFVSTILPKAEMASHVSHHNQLVRGAAATSSLAPFALHWVCMLFAMMMPLVLSPLRHAASRSLWSRRNLTVLLVSTGYAVPWLLFGLLIHFAYRGIAAGAGDFALPVLLVLAAAWQLTNAKALALARCNRDAVLPVAGWKANWACICYGQRLAWRCLRTCWALMVVCAVAQHAIWVVVLITVVVWSERMQPRPRLNWSCGVLVLTAGLSIVFGR